MHVSKINIRNFKSFYGDNVINLDENFNLIIGRNNAGKTSVLEASSLNISNKPHVSYDTKPSEDRQSQEPLANMIATITFQGPTIRPLYEGNPAIFMPVPLEPEDEDGKRVRTMGTLYRMFNLDDEWQIDVPIFNQYPTVQELQRYAPGLMSSFSLSGYELPPLNGQQQIRAYQIEYGGIDHNFYFRGQVDVNPEDLFLYKIVNFARSRTYRFYAERRIESKSIVRGERILRTDAQNLAEVLDVLSGNHAKFARYCQYVSRVLPDIKWVSINPAGQDQKEIRVWSEGHESERLDLTTALGDCGSGVGQVLAIVYVAMFYQTNHTIIIDEPQSFLHPGAARRLIKLLRDEFPNHQYIVSTHSPEIISSLLGSNIVLLDRNGFTTTATTLARNETESLKHALTGLGVTVADVFGMERILWVEGPTEEQCFPLIIRRAGIGNTEGLAIVPVVSTGSFFQKNRKKREDAIRLYEALSLSKALIPPALSFIFDSEELSDAEKADLMRLSDRVKFIPRRMYENYLLHNGALSYITAQEQFFPSGRIPEAEIDHWLEESRQAMNATAGDWVMTADGSKILKKFFQHFSDGASEYDKVEHGLMLTTWLLEHHPEQFEELEQLFHELIN